MGGVTFTTPSAPLHFGGTKENVLAVFADYEIDIYQHARGSRAPTK
jgi:hypothetical protein